MQGRDQRNKFSAVSRESQGSKASRSARLHGTTSVRDKGKKTGPVTVEEVENHHLLLKVRPGGKHVGVQKAPQNLVHRMRQ